MISAGEKCAMNNYTIIGFEIEYILLKKVVPPPQKKTV
jgi:hypothetical protein